MSDATAKKPPAAHPPLSPSEQIGPWMKENAEAIIVAFIMALVIRCFFIEVFKIPSSSMEPHLLGDMHDRCDFLHYHGGRKGGDRIMVTKYYYSLNDIQRYDVAVFRFPLNQARNFIKRVVGLPDEHLFIEDGDLFALPAGEYDALPEGGRTDGFRIAAKPRDCQRSAWIDVFHYRNLLEGPRRREEDEREPFEFGQNWSTAGSDAGFTVENGRLTTHEGDRGRSAKFTLQHRIRDDRSNPVHDVRIAFTLDVHGSEGRAFARIRNKYGKST
ncbi:MAG: S26 family signal peptidase, partial [Planctomycetota bacterium]